MNGININEKEEKAASYDNKVQNMLDQCRITQKILNYIEKFNYPYVSEVSYYEQLSKIGQGTFGEVFKARCKRTGRYVALKKILMENEKEGFPITALREIKMLQKLRHQHITELVEVCTSKQRSGKEKFCFYLVFTFCEHDLAGLLSNQNVKITLVHIKTMMQHILRGLHKIHTTQILHRDMKTANVLITADGVLKLADFGLARLMYKQPGSYTNRVVTLWYRPPELLLGSRHYGPSIDIWGAGCIMAELWIRTPILQGNTDQTQLDLISKLCGSINPQSWPGCENLPYYNNIQPGLIQNLPRRVRERLNPFVQKWANYFLARSDIDGSQNLASIMPQNSEQALSLIDWMLTLNPEKRPDASSALDHNFFFEQPIPADNIQELLQHVKGTNLFEYTSGCGAHANRRRPMAPAAPMHGQLQQQNRQKIAPSGGMQKGVNVQQQQQQRVQHQPQGMSSMQQSSSTQQRQGQGLMQQPAPAGANAVMQPPNISRKRPAPPASAVEQPSATRGPPPTTSGQFQQPRQPPTAGPASWQKQQQPQQSSSNSSAQHHFAPPPKPMAAANKWGGGAVEQPQQQQRNPNPASRQQQPKPQMMMMGGGGAPQPMQQRMVPPPPQPLIRPPAVGSNPTPFRHGIPPPQQQQYTPQRPQPPPRFPRPSPQNQRHQFFR